MELKRLLNQRYAHLGVFAPCGPSPSQTAIRKGKATWPFLECGTLIGPDRVSALSRKLTWLYRCPAFAGLALLCLASHIAVYRGIPHRFFLPHGSALLVVVLCLASIVAHELGHAAALRRFGAAPGRIGFGLYVLLPALFADVSLVWRLPRRQRYVVDLGGVYFQQIAFALFAGLALACGSSECLAVCYAIDTMSIVALNPIFRFDGYWLLTDWLGIGNLQGLALNYLKHLVFRPAGRSRTRLQGLSKSKSFVFIVYAAICNLFLAAVALYSWTYLHRLASAVFHGLPYQLSNIVLFARARQWGTVFDRLSVTLIALAFLGTAGIGLGMYAVRILRAVSRKIGNQFSTARMASS
ncbi:MAG TPA: hypothetical protein VHU83_24605 [Bryobacteraceae bacterium]|nr:hypothetical protein [Bryobacteraceae bacterium]